jgi:hypothetical protein
VKAGMRVIPDTSINAPDILGTVVNVKVNNISLKINAVSTTTQTC